MTKDELIDRMHVILDHSPKDEKYEYYVEANDWQNYGHDRTYFSIIGKGKYNPKRPTYRKRVEYRYGYLDNTTGEYHPHNKYNDLTKNYTLSGNIF